MQRTNRHGRIPYSEAHEHFQVYFGGAGGSVALHAAGIFEGGSAQVWDQARLSRLFDSLLDQRMLDADHKLREVQPLMAAFAQASPDEWRTGFLVFRPRGWPAELVSVLSRGLDGGNLVGLAIAGEPLRREYIRLHEGRRLAECRALYRAEAYERCLELAVAPIDPSPLDLLEFARRAAEPRLNDDPGQRDAFFEPLRKDGERRLSQALATYEAFLRELHQAEIDGARRLAS